MTTPKIGLALGSGSARGWAHVGVIRALEDAGIKADIIAGASVGSLVGAAQASDQLDTLESWIMGLTKRDVWGLLDTAFSRGGVMRGNKLMRAIGEQIKDFNIEDLPAPFGAVAADLHTGQEIWIQEGSMLNAVRASSGLPGLFSPMLYQRRWMIDGGVVNPVPVSMCRALGADYVIAVNLNAHYGKPVRFHKPQAASTKADGEQQNEQPSEGGWASRERWIEMMDGLMDTFRSDQQNSPARLDDNPPGLFDVIAGSVNIMQDRITRSRTAGDPPNIMLSPNLSHFQLMDFHRAAEAIEVGRTTVQRAQEELEELKDWMS
ncbi:MAG: patatin-like phospholipase RssA [Gammaproteobacteria bacterium]|jgi:NTE family protein|nr:patatin-like phospholipase RssA [Gammaproteobacteria bacterium]